MGVSIKGRKPEQERCQGCIGVNLNIFTSRHLLLHGAAATTVCHHHSHHHLKTYNTMASMWGSFVKNNPTLNGQMVSSTVSGLFSASLAASPFAYRALFGVDGTRAASCDADPTSPVLTLYLLTGMRTASETISRRDTLNNITKEYSIELKPLLSAFQMKPFAMTTVNSFLFNPLLLEHLAQYIHNDDDDAERHVDLVLLFTSSLMQILRETSVVTTRRVLERFVLHHCSQRALWKLLKDLPKSALRKSKRGMPFYSYTFCVARTTFRGRFLGGAALWLVQVGIECCSCVSDIVAARNEGEDDVVVYRRERVRAFGIRVCGVTVKCGASLVFASIGAGIGATLFRPTTGQSIGGWLGELAGPRIVAFCWRLAW